MRMGAPVSGEPGRERVIAGRYRLLSPLGEGGMGTVWRARDEVLRREVAVKEVRAPAGLPAPEVERMYTRLEREAWAAARVADRNVVTVYDVATDGGRPWIVMELVRGLSLADVLEAEGPVGPRRAAHIGAEVLSALRAAHAAGVLHRDVKPANVLLADDGRVVLTDFGIATVEGSSALTMTGEVVGSPEFLAPERALGRTPGPESDLWSLGVLLYAAVEGRSPFRQDTALSTLRAVVDEELPPPRRAGPLAAVIEGLLRKDPAERLPAEQAERDLRIIGAGGSPRAGSPPATACAPTAAARPYEPYEPSSAPPTPVPATGTRPVADPGGRRSRPDGDRRAVLALATGLAVLALALGGLTYALLHRGGGGDGGARTSDGPRGLTPSPTASAGRTATGGGSAPSASASSSSTPPPQSVTVALAGAHTAYSGTCPPPGEEAPAFTAAFTVGRLPAEVSYRWVLKSGEVSDPGWRTLSFPSGSGTSRRDTVRVTTYAQDGTFENAVSVEVRSPVRAVSNAVPFSVTCVTETPTGGASASGTASASP
ncbi:serine/threonine-protein kinase [Streptomyces kebangsaanensis]|uniref:non-specific serine/threonine protein kinase n=1 Tax=Streptomyces kebangsaanensis TaxID=864058 RepID=A0ABW6KS97_9ACTN